MLSRLGGLSREPAATESRHRRKTPEGPPCLQPRFRETPGPLERRERIELSGAPPPLPWLPVGSRIPQGRGQACRRLPLKRLRHPSDWPAAPSCGGDNPGTGGPGGGTGRGVGTCVQTLPKPPLPQRAAVPAPTSAGQRGPQPSPEAGLPVLGPTCRQWPCPASRHALPWAASLADPTFPGRGP